jgi:anti-sigma factor RsiW
MEQETIHDLVAAYALNALDPGEVAAFEEHLAGCERCREELASLEGVAAALAYVPEAPAPPEALRDRLLTSARSERANVVPLRPRARLPAVAAIAAVAACAAIGLGIWASSLSSSLDRERSARRLDDRALALAADPAATRVPLKGVPGTLIVGGNGEGALLIANLAPAPKGKTYEAWILGTGLPKRAGTFGGNGRKIFPLARPVRRGQGVAVTVERAGGVAQPTTVPILSVRLPA